VARRQPLAAVFVFPSLWVLAEWFRGWFLTGFPWLYLGNSQIDGWLAGWAPLGGVLALGWMAAFSGAALAQLGQLRDRAPGVIAGLLCAALPWLWGAATTIAASSRSGWARACAPRPRASPRSWCSRRRRRARSGTSWPRSSPPSSRRP